MKSKIIAAVMLVSLCAGIAPVALALPHADLPQMVQPTGATNHDHSCCPGLHTLIVTEQFVTAARPAMPCGENHPCCAKRAPGSPASLPAVNGAGRSGVEETQSWIYDPLFQSNHGFRCTSANMAFLPSSIARSTVLRI